MEHASRSVALLHASKHQHVTTQFIYYPRSIFCLRVKQSINYAADQICISRKYLLILSRIAIATVSNMQEAESLFDRVLIGSNAIE